VRRIYRSDFIWTRAPYLRAPDAGFGLSISAFSRSSGFRSAELGVEGALGALISFPNRRTGYLPSSQRRTCCVSG